MPNTSKFIMGLILAAGFAAHAGLPLCDAARNSDLTAVKARVAAGEDVNEVDGKGWTPLLWAVFYDSSPITEYLLAQGAHPDCQAGMGYHMIKQGCTPLILAGYYGLADCAEPLLKAGARLDPVDRGGFTAMAYAKEFKFTEVAALLAQAAVARSAEAAPAPQ
jgi:ankyrin repeat protein